MATNPMTKIDRRTLNELAESIIGLSERSIDTGLSRAERFAVIDMADRLDEAHWTLISTMLPRDSAQYRKLVATLRAANGELKEAIAANAAFPETLKRIGTLFDAIAGLVEGAKPRRVQ